MTAWPWLCSLSAADDHRAQALRHQQRERDVDDEEGADRGHAEEMDVARGRIVAEQRDEIIELHRLPYRQARQHDEHADHDDAGIEHPLHGIVDAEVIMAELE